VNDVRIFSERKVIAYVMNNISKVSLFQREVVWIRQRSLFNMSVLYNIFFFRLFCSFYKLVSTVTILQTVAKVESIAAI
jgi:hypothetical protein